MRIFKAVHTVLCHVNTSPVIYQLSNRESSTLIFPISRREIVAQHEMIGNRCGCQLLSSLSHIQGTNWCSRILVSRILVSVGSVYMVSVAVVGFQLQSVVSCIHVMKSCSAWVFACSLRVFTCMWCSRNHQGSRDDIRPSNIWFSASTWWFAFSACPAHLKCDSSPPPSLCVLVSYWCKSSASSIT